MRFIKYKFSVLKLMNAFQHVNDRFVEGKYLRQLVKGEVDPAGTDISGFFVFADGGAARWGVGAVDGDSVNAFLPDALTRVMRATVPIPALVLLLCCNLLLLVDLS